MANDKWRGVLGGLEETKSGGGEESPRARRVVRVRPVPGGFAVFDAKGSQLSEIHADRGHALAEAESWAGEGGTVLVESRFGVVEREVHAARPDPAGE